VPQSRGDIAVLFGKRRVEEELERIRSVNLPPDKTEAEVAEDITDDVIIEKPIETDEVKITAKDILAMTIAAFSIILPYVAIFIIVAVLFVYFFFR